MLRVELRDSEVLLDRVRHHARNLEPVVLELLAWTVLKLGPVEAEWKLYQARSGPNSFALIGPEDRFYFRAWGHGDPNITVYDAPVRGKVVETIRTRRDAKLFINWLAEALSPVPA